MAKPKSTTRKVTRTGATDTEAPVDLGERPQPLPEQQTVIVARKTEPTTVIVTSRAHGHGSAPEQRVEE